MRYPRYKETIIFRIPANLSGARRLHIEKTDLFIRPVVMIILVSEFLSVSERGSKAGYLVTYFFWYVSLFRSLVLCGSSGEFILLKSGEVIVRFKDRDPILRDIFFCLLPLRGD